MFNYYRGLSTMIKRIILYSSLLLIVFGQSTPTSLVAQEPLQIVATDLLQYPKVVVKVVHTNLNSTATQAIKILEKGKPQITTVTSLPSLRVGILADIYLGLNADIAKKLADAVDQLDERDWQWVKMQRSLFVPVGDNGREVGTQTGWTDKSWRSISNGIAAYYNATDRTFKPKATKTALKDLILDALNKYDNGTADHNYLIVLTDGFDKTSTKSIDEIVTLAQQNKVKIYLVNYDLSAQSVPNYILQALAKNLPTDIFALQDNGLDTIWQNIAQQPLTSTFTYQTQLVPPFDISIQSGDIGNAIYAIPDNIPAVKATIIQPQAIALIKEKNTTVQLALDWGGYPARELSGVTYSIAGSGEILVSNLELNSQNILSFQVADIPAGQPLLDIAVREQITGFGAVVVQTRLHTDFKATPTPAPPATPTPVPLTPSPPTWLDRITRSLVVRIPAPIVSTVSTTVKTVSTDPNFRQLAPWLFPIAALVALWLAVVAFRKAKRPIRFDEPKPQLPLDPTTRKTTKVPGDLKPIAQLILIQGERFLPAVIPLYEGRTKFGRDYSWADEYLPSRFVSLQQFAISISDDDQTIGNYSEGNHTLIDNVQAKDGSEENLETGSPLHSGSIIQFGIFKYKYQLIAQRGTPDYSTNGRMAAGVRSPNV